MGLHASTDLGAGHDVAAIYEEHYGLLVGIAVSRFRIPQADAETLAHEVFLDFLLRAPGVHDQRAWLIACICNASKHYLRTAQRTEPLPETGPDPADPRSARAVDTWPDELAAREAFERLTPRCQLALRLRYLDGHTIPEIAEILDQAPSRYCGGGEK